MDEFRYIGDCAKGFVQFEQPIGEPIVMPRGETVEVPASLAKKLARNRFFEQVTQDAVIDSEGTIEGEAEEIPEGSGECPDCGKILKLKKDGEVYAHDCDPDAA